MENIGGTNIFHMVRAPPPVFLKSQEKASTNPEEKASKNKALEIWSEMQRRSSQAAKACSHVMPLTFHDRTFIAALEDCFFIIFY